MAYLGIGFPVAIPAGVKGLAVLLWIPRLWLMLAVLAGIYVWLWRDESAHEAHLSAMRAGRWGTEHWERSAWAAAMVVATVLVSILTTLRVEKAERTEYAYRVPLAQQGLLNAQPQATKDGVRYVAFGFNGYRLMTQDAEMVWWSILRPMRTWTICRLRMATGMCGWKRREMAGRGL